MPVGLGLFLLAGAVAVISMVWVGLRGMSGQTGRAVAVLAVALALAGGPSLLMRLRGAGTLPHPGLVLAGATLLILAAAVALWRLRAAEGAGLVARVGIGACAVLWLALLALRSGYL